MKIRYEDIKPTFIKVLVASLICAHVVCWSVCYIVSTRNGSLKYPNLFLSRAMDQDPSRAFACVAFPIMAIMTGLVLLIRSVLLSARLKTRVHRRIWRAFNAFSIITSFCMIVVPAVPYSLSRPIHMAAAYSLFISGFMIMFISTYLDTVLRLEVVDWIRKLRLCLNILAFVGFLGFAVFFYMNSIISATCEIVAAACMFSFICTLAHESDFFSNYNTTLEAKPEQITSLSP